MKEAFFVLVASGQDVMAWTNRLQQIHQGERIKTTFYIFL